MAASKKKLDINKLLDMARIDNFTVMVVIAAFITGFVVSSVFFKQVEIQYIDKPVVLTPVADICDEPEQTQQAPQQQIVYDLQASLDVLNPTIGRGETLIFSGRVTDLLSKLVGEGEVNASILDSKSSVVNSGTFPVFPNSTYDGKLNIPQNITELGTYVLKVQASLGSRWSLPKSFNINIVR